MDKQIIHLNSASFKTNENNGHLVIEGYAAHWNTPNKNGEIVDANSFEYWLNELKQGGQKPMMNYNHNADQIIGGWDLVECDNNGLYVIGHINSDVTLCKDTIIPLVKNGDLNSLSTEGFSNAYENEVQDGCIYIKNFILTAIALVGLPADFFAKFEIKNGLVIPKVQPTTISKWYLFD